MSSAARLISRARLHWSWLALYPVLAFAGCGQTVPVGVDDPLAAGTSAVGAVGGSLGTSGGGAVASSGGGAASAGAPPCEPTECRGKVYECGNCDDDDADGLVDSSDPACLGPCDDDEAGLSTGISNSSAACRQDCYFDGDAGPGNDKCDWTHECDPLSMAPNYPPSGQMRCAYDAAATGLRCEQLLEEQPAACLEKCLPVVPNGCDCFGCCELPARSGEYHYVGKGRGALGCSLEALTDAEACPPCTPVLGCLNPCETCEACVGGGQAPGCDPGPLCEDGQQPCGRDAPCGTGSYCVTGCCIRAPVR